MPTLQVQAVQPGQPFKTAEFGEFIPVTVMGLLDGQLDSVTMNCKSEATFPKVGDTLEGAVEAGKYGKKFKKSNPAYAPGAPAQQGFRERSPEVQDAIMRQHAVTDAISFIGLLPATERKDLATKENALKLADWFLGYYKYGMVKQAAPLPVAAASDEPFDDGPYGGEQA